MADRALFEIHLHDGITFSPTATGFRGWRRGDDEDEEMEEFEDEMEEMEEEMEELEDEMEEMEEATRGPGRLLVLALVLAVGVALGMKLLGDDADEMDSLDDIAEEFEEGEETIEQ
jgi:hypothetical protein